MRLPSRLRSPLERRGRRLAVAALLLSVTAAAALHIALRHSSPASGANIASSPARISLWFTLPPQAAISSIRLEGPSGAIALGAVASDTGNGISVPLRQAIGPGSYTVHWRTASADGHPIQGSFTFTVGPAPGPGPAAGPSATGGSDSAPAPPSASDNASRRVGDATGGSTGSAEPSEYRGVRWIEFVALLTILGSLGFRHGVLPPLAIRGVPTADAADRARRLGLAAVFLYALAAVMRLYTTSAAFHGPAAALEPGPLAALLGDTTWGLGWSTGAVGAVLAGLGFWIAKRLPTLGSPLALSGALGLTLSPALSGHSAASDLFIISVTFDMLHVAAAGVWIGGLFMVMAAGLPAMRRLSDGNPDAAVGALVSSFHPLALFCAPLVVVAGVGMSWLRLGGLAPLIESGYGRALLVKLALFALVAAMGGYNALRARRRLGQAPGTLHFRKTASVELILATLVVAATTALVALPPPVDMSSE